MRGHSQVFSWVRILHVFPSGFSMLRKSRRLDGDRLRGIKRRDLGGYQKRIIEKYVR